ncbi:hypothetical protein [Dactylosporangium sp. NPDC005555]|uniref:hypothetical protein n=1 Tax=Dactylosporangium sp. NPDC005555 TaxID=3154889 RepID=UPI0033A9CB08
MQAANQYGDRGALDEQGAEGDQQGDGLDLVAAPDGGDIAHAGPADDHDVEYGGFAKHVAMAETVISPKMTTSSRTPSTEIEV